jgi:hypothetical protein
MNRKTRSSYARVFVIAASFVSCAGAVEFVTGRVVDIGLSGPKNGIAGVTVVISELTTQKSVGNPGITDGEGAYKIEINTPHTTKLVAKFSKIGYFTRPTYQPVASLTRAQPSVKLAKGSAPEAYYKAVADNIWIVYSADPNAATASFSAVTSLLATEKAVVFNALKLKEGDAYKSFKVADETYQATQTFLSNYDESIDFSAYANYGSTGTVWLFGAVPDDDIKSSVERAIKRSTAVQNVQNDLAISK